MAKRERMSRQETRNPKHEIRNKFKEPKSECAKRRVSHFWFFGSLCFGFVSDFVLRASDFVLCGVLCFGFPLPLPLARAAFYNK
jgi:hypothetical protein